MITIKFEVVHEGRLCSIISRIGKDGVWILGLDSWSWQPQYPFIVFDRLRDIREYLDEKYGKGGYKLYKQWDTCPDDLIF